MVLRMVVVGYMVSADARAREGTRCSWPSGATTDSAACGDERQTPAQGVVRPTPTPRRLSAAERRKSGGKRSASAFRKAAERRDVRGVEAQPRDLWARQPRTDRARRAALAPMPLHSPPYSRARSTPTEMWAALIDAAVPAWRWRITSCLEGVISAARTVLGADNREDDENEDLERETDCPVAGGAEASDVLPDGAGQHAGRG